MYTNNKRYTTIDHRDLSNLYDKIELLKCSNDTLNEQNKIVKNDIDRVTKKNCCLKQEISVLKNHLKVLEDTFILDDQEYEIIQSH